MQAQARTTRGFTLAEMVMALAVGSVIAMAAGGVAMGLSYSQQHQDDYRESVQSAGAVMREVRTLVHKAQLIAGAWGDRVVIWTDTDANGQASVTELTVVYYDSATRQVLEARVAAAVTWAGWPVTGSPSALTAAIAHDAATFQAILASTSGVQTSVLAEDVWGFSVSGAQVGAYNNRIEVSVTAGTGARRFTLRSAFTLRAGQLSRG